MSDVGRSMGSQDAFRWLGFRGNIRAPERKNWNKRPTRERAPTTVCQLLVHAAKIFPFHEIK